MPRIRHVIDTGVVKARTHHPTTGLDVLRVEKVSKAQAWQRTGRAVPRSGWQMLQNLHQGGVREDEGNACAGDTKVFPSREVALQLLAIGVDIHQL
ncbi:hypothetical protein K0M31_015844 [Melipona bicolor]|uniref:Uncharacterized protein n=1 Tax=Melipona bicolor TaxID=60889 RepID=A0AA40FEV3_9HYME|nr:hypothetical protein K0M31_015844 [Melipona bicolor]